LNNNITSNKITLTVDDEVYNFDTYEPYNDKQLISYDWVADTATTSHISNQCNAFIMFKTFTKTISRVSNVTTCAEG
jgi:hypothetical protein